MPARSSVVRILPALTARNVVTPSLASRATFTAVAVAAARQCQHTAPPIRAFSTSLPWARKALDPKWANSAPVSYDELKPITKSPNDDVLLVDVREPSEVALGSIPSSVNMPLSSFEKSLSMDEGDFTRTHGFHKPTKTQPIIFYCKAGVRAQTAVDLAKRAGFKAARNYVGSYDDWVKRDTKSQDD